MEAVSDLGGCSCSQTGGNNASGLACLQVWRECIYPLCFGARSELMCRMCRCWKQDAYEQRVGFASADPLFRRAVVSAHADVVCDVAG